MTVSIEVSLRDRSHVIWVGTGLLESLMEYLPPGEWRRILVVTDKNVARFYLDRVLEGLGTRGAEVFTYEIDPGERAKDLENVEHIYGVLADNYFSRGDVVLALGGGVVGDLVGFAAGTFKRGVGLVQLPTTLMAQVDSSIGGKNGVNLPQGKNLAGVFYQPLAIIADTSALATLPEREFLSGWAEVLKYYLVFSGRLREILDGMSPEGTSATSGEIPVIVEECARLKAQVVMKDEFDRGERAYLNYGHSFGHALEALEEYSGAYSHGEAISIGMVFAAAVSAAAGICEPGLVDEHRRLIDSWGLPTSLGERELDFDSFKEILLEDKKNVGALRMVLLEGIGRPVLMEDIEDASLERGIVAVGGA